MKNKKRVRPKVKIFGFLILIGLLISLIYLFKDNLTSTVFNANNSQTYLKAQEMGLFKNEYSEHYNNINYIEDENFILVINVLLDKKYTTDEINNIYRHLDKGNIVKLLDNNYLELSDFFGISNFDVSNYNRYITAIDKKEASVFKREDLTLSDVVTYVNIGLDNVFYSTFEEISDSSNILVLVNKYNKLPDNYEPVDLETINTPIPNSDTRVFKLRKVAKDAFENLLKDALAAGHKIFPYSAYRSYEYQKGLYNTYVNRDGATQADTYSARPGFSEHQLGLAVDIRSEEYSNQLNKSAFNWINENAQKYGFVIRYPQGQIDITGYVYEDWHLRYLGVEVATDLKDKNITYDEYYDLYIKSK